MLPFEDETAVNEPELPLPEGKMSFKPEELYRFTRIKPFVLRFWESEFPSLKPKKKGPEGLEYIRADVEMILAIKHLLYVEGLTLAGARQRLSGEDVSAPKKSGAAPRKQAKKKRATPKPAAKKKVPGKKDGDAPPAAAAKHTEKISGKRGLPGDGASRSRVSLEELLPGDSAAGGAGPGTSKKKKPAAGTSATNSASTPSTPLGDTEARELRRKLSVALKELREILTFLNKGDR